MSFDYDLFVIGAGPGGLAASERAKSYGARVAIAEQEAIGGTCVIRGCIPERLMSHAASFATVVSDAAGYGWQFNAIHTPKLKFDWQQFTRNRDQEIKRLSQLHQQHLEEARVDLIWGRATFIDAHTVEIAGRQITADKILIAVGSSAVKPNIPGGEYVITSRELFQLQHQPQQIVVVGGNYIAVKLTGILQQLGCQVIQIVPENCILTGLDHDLCRVILNGLRERGVEILTNADIQSIEAKDDRRILHLENKLLEVDQVLYAIDRVPNLTDLGLEKAGVEVNNGLIPIDPYCRTSQDNIYAVGDCVNRLHWTPVAIAEARSFVDTQFSDNFETVSYTNVPAVVSDHPEAATVGLAEAEAREKYDAIRCYMSEFRPLTHSLAKRTEKTLVKLVVHEETDRILGAHMVGDGATEIIQCLAIAIRLGATKKDFDNTMGIHPSVGEEFLTLK